MFEGLVLSDNRFEIPAERHLGMVVFRLNGENSLTEKLLKRMNARGLVHCVPAELHGIYVIRFTITSANTMDDDILEDWLEIKKTTDEILKEISNTSPQISIQLDNKQEWWTCRFCNKEVPRELYLFHDEFCFERKGNYDKGHTIPSRRGRRYRISKKNDVRKHFLEVIEMRKDRGKKTDEVVSRIDESDDRVASLENV